MQVKWTYTMLKYVKYFYNPKFIIRNTQNEFLLYGGFEINNLVVFSFALRFMLPNSVAILCFETWFPERGLRSQVICGKKFNAEWFNLKYT